jgi:hypothetical protein
MQFAATRQLWCATDLPTLCQKSTLYKKPIRGDDLNRCRLNEASNPKGFDLLKNLVDLINRDFLTVPRIDIFYDI